MPAFEAFFREIDKRWKWPAKRLRDLAGEKTALHVRHKVYLDIVHGGLPFLPHPPSWHALSDLNATLQHFEIEALDVVDVVVTKLKRFSANDQSDIAAMVKLDLVPPALLVARFRAAVDAYGMDARASDLPKYVSNLHQVERDQLLVAESEIELPGWI